MNLRALLHSLGGLLLFLGVMLLLPLPIALFDADGTWPAFAGASALTALAGSALYLLTRGRNEVTLREGFAIVTFAWLAFAAFGAIPYIISGGLVHPIDAFFESMSGFTTCGASVMSDVEGVPRSVLFWRALTQWIGGMGFIVLGVAILPLLGVGGMQLYEAEVAGPTAERLAPRVQDTARLLWGTYAAITAVGVLLLWVGEMSLFDALCHTFAAVATGGFSTRNASLGAFGTYSQVVVIGLMLAGAINFALHFFALRGRFRKAFASEELRRFLLLGAAILLVVLAFNSGRYESQLLNLRDSTFTVVSILTTTGFATADYEHWHVLPQGLLLCAMFVGACAGSTSGGLKQVRLVLLAKHALLQARSLIHPRQVTVLRFDGRPVSPEIMRDVLGLTVLFVGAFLAGALLLAAAGLDLVTAMSASIACLSTVGPGLGAVGPMENYAALPAFAKIVLSFVMLLGRLEIWTVLVLFFRSCWRR